MSDNVARVNESNVPTDHWIGGESVESHQPTDSTNVRAVALGLGRRGGMTS